MILQKIINKLNISNDYIEFVDSFKSQLLDEFGDKIHSIYMCGSIPKGSAKPYESDADFTILCDKSNDIDRDKIIEIKSKLLDLFPIVTKIDTVICTLDDVRNKPNEWGFWIKIVCINIYGDDFGENVPPIVASNQFIIDLNSDTKQAINRVRSALINTSDAKLKRRYIKGYSKKLLRALSSLIMEEVGEWQDNITEMKYSIIKYSEINSVLVEFIYECYLNSDVDIESFLDKADEVYIYFEDRLKEISSSSS